MPSFICLQVSPVPLHHPTDIACKLENSLVFVAAQPYLIHSNAFRATQLNSNFLWLTVSFDVWNAPVWIDNTPNTIFLGGMKLNVRGSTEMSVCIDDSGCLYIVYTVNIDGMPTIVTAFYAVLECVCVYTVDIHRDKKSSHVSFIYRYSEPIKTKHKFSSCLI